MNNFTYMKDKDFSSGRDYIGASDMTTITGINEYQSPYELWETRTGRKKGFSGNFLSAEGHFKEAGILGKKLAYDSLIKNIGPDFTPQEWLSAITSERVNNFITSRLWNEVQFENLHSWTEARAPENKRHVAHADLLNLSEKSIPITQAKNTGVYAANTRKRNPYKGYAKDDLSQNGIPLGVFFQEQWEMYCYGVPRAEVAVDIGGNEWKLYGPIDYNKKTVEKLVILADAMLECIDTDTPPDPQTWPDVLSMFPDLETHTKSTISGQDELDARKMVSQHAKYTNGIKLLKKKQLDITMALAGLASEPDLGVMHNYLTASDGSTIASFSDRQGQRRISVTKLEKEEPDLFDDLDSMGFVTQDATSRSIRIAGAHAGSVDMYTLITFDDESKPKRSRKKYTGTEKKDYSDFCRAIKLRIDWERYSTK